MAVTSIWSIKGWIGKVINYAENPDKTKENNEGQIAEDQSRSTQGLNDVITYAVNAEKTRLRQSKSMEMEVVGESEELMEQYVSGVNCAPTTAREEMIAVKKRFGKEDGIVAFHGYQSFAPGECNPAMAHEIGKKLAEELWGSQYQVLIATHLDKANHLHNHFVVNSVSFIDGKRYHRTNQDYRDMRMVSDRLCKEYQLSVVRQPEQGKGKHYVEWQAEQEGKPTWRTAIRLDIRESVQESYSWLQFLKEMEKRGYTWKLNRKYISLKAPGMERYIRLRSLGKNYSEEEIRGQILQPKVKRVYQKAVQIHPKKKLTGIQALYYSYLYQMGVLPKRPKRSPYAVREDIRKLDRRIEQIEFLLKHDIITREQLAAYREPLQKQIAELMKERRRLYRNGGRETGEERLSEINEELKRLRKEVRMTVQIEKHSLEIEAKLQKAEEQSQNEKRVEDKERMQKSQEVR